MRTINSFIVIALLLVIAPARAFAGQQHVVDPSSVAKAVAEHADQQDADRRDVQAALARPEVRELAAKAGVDIDRASSVVSTLSGADLDRAANLARQVTASLTGGDSYFTISSTTLIIILLLVLLIIVAVR
jgi:hypothetical protein